MFWAALPGPFDDFGVGDAFAEFEDDDAPENDGEIEVDDGSAGDAMSIAGSPGKKASGNKGRGAGPKTDKGQAGPKLGQKWCRGHGTYHLPSEFPSGQAVCYQAFNAERALKSAAVKF